MPPTSPSGTNGSGPVPGEVPAGLKTPAPHPVPSLAAQMAEAGARQQAAAQAELQARVAALHDQIALMLATDPASLLMALPDLFGASLVEMVAAGVQLGIERATHAGQGQGQPGPVEARKPILLAHTGNIHMAAQAAMGGMPAPGTPPA